MTQPTSDILDKDSLALLRAALDKLAARFGWQTHLGHLTGGGTMANLEALWVAGQLRTGLPIVASEQAHYTHKRISNALGLKFEAIPADRCGRLDLDSLTRRLAEGE